VLSKGEVEGGYNAKKASKGYPAVPGCTGFSLFRRSVWFFVYDGLTIPSSPMQFSFPSERGELVQVGWHEAFLEWWMS